jgi:hypothetical protein
LGGIPEDFVVGFAGPRPQEVNCGPWLTTLCCLLSLRTFQRSTGIAAGRMRALGFASSRVFIVPATLKPPFSTRHSSSTSTVTSAPMRSASSPAQDHCAALCLRVSSSFLPAVVSREGKLSRTKYILQNSSPYVKVTRRHHPLYNQELEVLNADKQTLVLRLADGSPMKMPRAWCGSPKPPAMLMVLPLRVMGRDTSQP